MGFYCLPGKINCGKINCVQGWDVALVRLERPVVGFGQTRLYSGTSELGMEVTVLGAGLAGRVGEDLAANDAGTIHAFRNTIDRVISLEAGGLLLYDFDDGTAGKNTLANEAAFDALGQPVAGGNILGRGSATGLTFLEGTSAPGDSGGPAFADFGNGPELVGIVSWGVNPSEPGNLYGSGYGDVGTLMRVSAYEGWIASVIPEPGVGSLLMAGVCFGLRLRGRPQADGQ